MIVSRTGSVLGKAPKRQLRSTPIAVSGSGHTGNNINSLNLPSIRKSASQAVLSRVQLTLHATRRTPHGASRLVQVSSAWSVKIRRAPSRYCRDTRVFYGHTTTAMHDTEYLLLSRHPPPRDRGFRSYWVMIHTLTLTNTWVRSCGHACCDHAHLPARVRHRHYNGLNGSVMKIMYVTLTAATIAMMKKTPSLRASYDSSLVRKRHAHRLMALFHTRYTVRSALL